MTVTTDLWGRHAKATGISSSDNNQQNPTVVFTTEAKEMMQEQQAWLEGDKHADSPFEFDFVTHSRDLLTGSGFIKHVGTYVLSLSCPYRITCSAVVLCLTFLLVVETDA